MDNCQRGVCVNTFLFDLEMRRPIAEVSGGKADSFGASHNLLLNDKEKQINYNMATKIDSVNLIFERTSLLQKLEQ